MKISVSTFKKWWTEDVYRSALLIFGFLLACFFAQGMPYWDCDYNVNFAAARGQSLFQLVWGWVSPIYTGIDNWGFLDRPAQFIVYKFCFAIAGYHAWPYILFKCACFAGLGAMIYTWALRLLPETSKSRMPAAAAALCFLVAPGPVGSLVWLADFGVAAELVFLIVTLIAWEQIERTPVEWRSLSLLHNPEHRKWLYKWIALSFAVYLGYKTKADLKLIPLIIAGYVLLTRWKQWRLFGIPIAMMLILAVPWSPQVLTKLPPFIPGSRAAAGGYVWAPANFDVWRQFLWSSDPYSFAASWRSGTLSLAGLLGPFLLSVIVVYLIWRLRSFSTINWNLAEAPQARARLFVIIWFGVILVGVSALPAVSYFFRIRWSILTLIPVSILLAWIFNLFREPLARMPRWAAAGCVAVICLQAGLNLSRSIVHRWELGQTMIAVDQVYAYVAKTYPNDELAIAPSFLSYNYRTDVGSAFLLRDSLSSLDDLSRRHTPNRTSVIAWQPSLWEQLDVVGQFSGCTAATLFEAVFSCPADQGVFLMRYIGPDPGYQAAEAARTRGDIAGARNLYEEFLTRHPLNMGAQFKDGVAAYQQQDWAGSERAFAILEEDFPGNSSVLYNRAMTLLQLKQNGAAIKRLKRVVAVNPRDYDALANLYRAFGMNGDQKEAAATLQTIQTLYPGNNPQSPILALRDASGNQYRAPLDELAAAEQLARTRPTPENYLNLSLQLDRSLRYEDSIKACRAALKLNPDYAEADNNIAAAYEAMGMWDEAIGAAQEALRLKPGYQLAQNNLNWSLSQKKLHGASPSVEHKPTL